MPPEDLNSTAIREAERETRPEAMEPATVAPPERGPASPKRSEAVWQLPASLLTPPTPPPPPHLDDYKNIIGGDRSMPCVSWRAIWRKKQSRWSIRPRSAAV